MPDWHREARQHIELDSAGTESLQRASSRRCFWYAQKMSLLLAHPAEARATAAEDKLRDREAEIERLRGDALKQPRICACWPLRNARCERSASEKAPQALDAGSRTLAALRTAICERYTDRSVLRVGRQIRGSGTANVIRAALASTEHPASSEEATPMKADPEVLRGASASRPSDRCDQSARQQPHGERPSSPCRPATNLRRALLLLNAGAHAIRAPQTARICSDRVDADRRRLPNDGTEFLVAFDVRSDEYPIMRSTVLPTMSWSSRSTMRHFRRDRLRLRSGLAAVRLGSGSSLEPAAGSRPPSPSQTPAKSLGRGESDEQVRLQ